MRNSIMESKMQKLIFCPKMSVIRYSLLPTYILSKRILNYQMLGLMD